MLARVDKIDGIYLKRNDLNEFCGCFGGKAECIYDFISNSEIKTFVTCGSRDSLQCEIVSQMCEVLGYSCHIFMPSGSDTPSIIRMKGMAKTVLHPIRDGYMVVVKKRARDFAEECGMTLIPFGMQTPKSVKVIAKQVENIPEDIKRIVVPVGGGITICGVMQGLVDFNRKEVEVLGVITGCDPKKVIKVYQPMFNPIRYELQPWAEEAPTKRYSGRQASVVGDVKLDAVYEGKCREFLRENDLLWIVGYHEV